MSARRRTALAAAAILAGCVAWWLLRPPPAVPPPPPAPVPAAPRLLPPPADPAAPRPAWAWLLAADGSPEGDVNALADLIRNLLETVPADRLPPLGADDDLARALTDPSLLGEALLPADHPALRDGRLVDRWGTPFHLHPVSSSRIDVRSAGPDRRLFTGDDWIAATPE